MRSTNLAATKTKTDGETGFKREKVITSRYKNWSKKINKTATKTRNKHGNVILQADVKTINSSGSSETKGSSKHKVAPGMKHKGGNKTLKLLSLTPTANKKRKKDANSGEEKGNDEYKFDDIGSRNELIWRNNRSLKDRRKRILHL